MPCLHFQLWAGPERRGVGWGECGGGGRSGRSAWPGTVTAALQEHMPPVAAGDLSPATSQRRPSQGPRCQGTGNDSGLALNVRQQAAEAHRVPNRDHLLPVI